MLLRLTGFVATVFALLAFAPSVDADDATCGTVILPTGLGASASAAVGSLNPLLTTGLYDHEVIQQILRPLVWIDRTGEMDPARSVAASVTSPDGGASFLVTLHDWRWSDGTPIDADDVTFTFDLIARLGAGYVYYGTGGMPNLIASWQAVGSHQVLLRMKQRVNPRWFVSLGLGNILFPLPKHVFQGMSLVELRRRQTDPSLFAVGDGPFSLKQFAIGRHLVLEPNPLYGGAHPHIRRLVISFPSGNGALEQLRSGELDMANLPFLLERFAASIPGVRVTRLAANDTYGEGIFNFASREAPFLADISVRSAITRAIDQSEIIGLVFRGAGSIDHGPVPASMAALQSADARRSYPALSYDPAAAAKLLADDGWKPGPDGVLRKDGRPLAFTVITSSESTNGILMAQVIQRDLARVGITMRIQAVGFNQLLATLDGNGHAWDLALLNWTIDTYPDVHDFFAADGTQNYGHYRDATMDRLTTDEMFGSGDSGLLAVQDFAARQAPYLYLPAGTPHVLVRDGIGGVEQFLSPNGMWSAEALTLSPPLSCPEDAPHA